MNKLGLFVVLATLCSFSSAQAEVCTSNAKDLFQKAPSESINFVDMKDKCVSDTQKQIKMEITASLKYLSMAAFFSKDGVNRPGFAKLFFDAASEEREHAYKLIEYLSMRGRYLTTSEGKPQSPDIDISQLVKKAADLKEHSLEDFTAPTETRTSGLIALQNALKLETLVTASIRNLVASCESSDNFNHYHFVDYLTGEFLEEQYKGQRDLAGKISTLGKMVKAQGAATADFLFDKQLL